MRRMILFSGKAEHGKTTASEILKKQLEELGYKVVITRYAYYLKDLATRYCGWNGQKDNGGRELLQQLGTDIIRQKLNKPNFHVGRICEDVEICQIMLILLLSMMRASQMKYIIQKQCLGTK